MALCKHKRCCVFLMGAGMGAAAGMLLAPKSGNEIRRELFGGPLDLLAEPGTETAAPRPEMEAAEDLKARIEETRARLKAEVEAGPDGKS